MRLNDLVKIDNRFEKSVNLSLDLNIPQKVDGYIPTRSSVKVLEDYIDEVRTFSGNRATVLIGPYGKGKSHLLLVLMALLSQDTNMPCDNLIARIDAVDHKTAEKIRSVRSTLGRFLPVIINANGTSLNQAFMRGLIQALNREDLIDIIPDSYYSEAVKTIQSWKTDYKKTYKAFQSVVAIDGSSSNMTEYLRKLQSFDRDALEFFKTVYPQLTSGGVFNPMVDDEIISVYRSVNRQLRTKYGYGGIYVIFDEFSKYIEGHPVERFAADMKVLQDMCELCNASSDEQLHLTCVAHKTIKSYGNTLPAEILNAFQGVEGRLKEKFFVVTSQNNYELISDAIAKTDAFDKWANSCEKYQELVAETFELKTFSSLFSETDYREIVGKGCFPMTPTTAMLLLSLSEKIAQNERTIFTYIAGRDTGSLTRFVESCKGIRFVGTSHIYDYFVPLFKEETTPGIHHEWLKADYAISKTEDAFAAAVIKSMAVIHMVNRPDEIVTSEKFIRLACGFEPETCANAIAALVDAKLIEYKNRTGTYEFKNNVGVDVEVAISDCVKKRFSKIVPSKILNEVASEKFVIPKKHNQTYSITRYFNRIFMSASQFLAVKSTEYIEWNNQPDGVVAFILPGEDFDEEAVAAHAQSVEGRYMVVCIPNQNQMCEEQIKVMLAAEYLSRNSAFLEGNQVILKELQAIVEDKILEINEWIEATYFPVQKIYGRDGRMEVGPFGLNRLVSDVCDHEYSRTPIINNELINRHSVSSQIAKSRNIILADMLAGRDCGKYLTGTSAESTIYRAIWVHTQNDPFMPVIKAQIEHFIQDAVGNKISFSHLIDILTTAPYGMRKGVIPFYLMDGLLKLQDLPVVYLGNKEVVIDVETITNIVKRPCDYSLYVENETAQKNQYLHGLEEAFSDFNEYCREVDKRNQLAMISCLMQSWYRSLPQTSMTFKAPDYDGQNIREINAFRRIFSEMYLNPREILFEQLPKTFKTDRLDVVLNKVIQIRRDVDAHIHTVKQMVAGIIRTEFQIAEGANLSQSLKLWYEDLPEVAKNSVLSNKAATMIAFIKGNSLNDEEELASRFVREISGNFIEDWKADTEESFRESISEILAEIGEKKDTEPDAQTAIKLEATGGASVECYYNYDPSNLSTNGSFFKRALDDMMEEYDGVLDNNEKIGILMELVRNLAQGKE